MTKVLVQVERIERSTHKKCVNRSIKWLCNFSAVNKAMPALQEKYDADLKAAQEKAAQEKATQEKAAQEKAEEEKYVDVELSFTSSEWYYYCWLTYGIGGKTEIFRIWIDSMMLRTNREVQILEFSRTPPLNQKTSLAISETLTLFWWNLLSFLDLLQPESTFFWTWKVN